MNRPQLTLRSLRDFWWSIIVRSTAFIFMSPFLAAQETPGLLRCSDAYQIVEQRELPAPVAMEGMRFEPKEYAEFDAIEWQVTLQSKDDEQSPLFENFPAGRLRSSIARVFQDHAALEKGQPR